MSCLRISGLGTHKVAELKCDGLVIPAALSRLQLKPQLVEFDGEEADRHITIESLSVRPALHPVFIRESLVY